MTRPTRRGRPPGTSGRRLELTALRLFSAQGFDQTTVEQIATSAGVSTRTFFRYFDSKAAVLWHGFDREVAAIRTMLARAPDDLPVMTAIRRAVLAVNSDRAGTATELRARIRLLGSAPDLMASATVRYRAWERAISEFVAYRTGRSPDSLYPLTVGRATLAACHAAYDCWAEYSDGDLTTHLNTALRALESGFSDAAINHPDQPSTNTVRTPETKTFEFDDNSWQQIVSNCLVMKYDDTM